MEQREIFAVIIAVMAVCILIGIISLFRNETLDESEVPAASTSMQTLPAETTDLWDVLRAEQSSETETTLTTSELPPDVSSESITSVSGVTSLPGAVTETSAAETPAASTASTASTAATDVPGYTIVVQ